MMHTSIKCDNLSFTEYEFYISHLFAYLSEYISGMRFRPSPCTFTPKSISVLNLILILNKK